MASEELALKQELKDVLTEILLEEQENGPGNSPACCRPDDWLKAPSLALSGCSIREMRRQTGMGHYPCKRIHGLVMAHDEAKNFRKERAIQLASHSVQLSELEGKIVENLLDPENEERVKEFGPKELQQLALAGKLSMESFDRVTGANVQRIEVTHKTTPEEARSLIDALTEAIDAEVIED